MHLFAKLCSLLFGSFPINKLVFLEGFMNVGIVLLIALASYLIGSVSFARLVTKRLAPGKDVTQFEIPVDGTEERYKVISIGANSVSGELGPMAGMIVSLLDILKIILPTLFCRLYFTDQPVCMLTAALGGLTGHIWPIYYHFHGGSGYSAILGGLLVIDPLAALVTPVAGILLGMIVLRNVIVASISWIWLIIPWLWWRNGGDPVFILYAVIVNIIFILAMVPEIKMALNYTKQGKKMAYGMGNLTSNPMGRGLLKMAKFFKVEVK
jgi:acyl phosphate:glycerol-3-phosphate acyltransferase